MPDKARRRRLDMARGLEYADAARQAAHDALDWRGMAAEVAAVAAAVRRLAPPQAFSHNDLLSGNILVSTLVRRLPFRAQVARRVCVGMPDAGPVP